MEPLAAEDQHDRGRKEAPDSTTRTGASKQPRRGPATQPGLAVGEALVQAKLAVGAVDDPYEREADAVACRVVRMLRSDTPSADRNVAGRDGAQR